MMAPKPDARPLSKGWSFNAVPAGIAAHNSIIPRLVTVINLTTSSNIKTSKVSFKMNMSLIKFIVLISSCKSKLNQPYRRYVIPIPLTQIQSVHKVEHY